MARRPAARKKQTRLNETNNVQQRAGVTPERLKELQEMEKDGTLDAYCRSVMKQESGD